MIALFRRFRFVALFMPVAVALLFAPSIRAATTGVISGTVKATDGAPFKGAFVRAQNRKSKINFIVLSDKQGKYRLDDLAPGDYDVRASTVDFKTDPRRVSLTADQPAVVD